MEPSLGQQLKLARAQRGLSLADVAHATRVPLARLQHLEEDNLAAFGNLAYARSFARIYSRYLDVDAEHWVKSLPRPIFAGAHDYRYLTNSFGPWVEPVRKRVRMSIHRPGAAPERRRWHAFMLFVIIAIGSIMLGSQILLPERNLPTSPAPGPTGLPAPASLPSADMKSYQRQPEPRSPKLVSFATQPGTSQVENIGPDAVANESGEAVRVAPLKP